MRAIAIILGLAIANFGMQCFLSENWSAASERSFFQAIAILAYVIWAKVDA
jgi:hypothetical protein